MKKYIRLLTSLFGLTFTSTMALAEVPPVLDPAKMEGLAMKGNYQAQRNLAYSLASTWPSGQKNPILGCAWYLVILQSGSPKVDETDINNVKVYCSQLDDLSRIAAENQAAALLHKIYPKQH